MDSWGQNCFNEFVWPRRNVHPKATLTNNFYTMKGGLYRHGEELECLDLVDALMAFLEWLQELGGNVVLVAHKCLDYDAKVLLRNLEEFSIPYTDTIIGFSDSLLASRQLYTEVRREGWVVPLLCEVLGPLPQAVLHAVRGGAACERGARCPG